MKGRGGKYTARGTNAMEGTMHTAINRRRRWKRRLDMDEEHTHAHTCSRARTHLVREEVTIACAIVFAIDLASPATAVPAVCLTSPASEANVPPLAKVLSTRVPAERVSIILPARLRCSRDSRMLETQARPTTTKVMMRKCRGMTEGMMLRVVIAASVKIICTIPSQKCWEDRASAWRRVEVGANKKKILSNTHCYKPATISRYPTVE